MKINTQLHKASTDKKFYLHKKKKARENFKQYSK